MLHISDELAGSRLDFYCAESKEDAYKIFNASLKRNVWALDTESTGINPYRPLWRLRTFQFGHSRVSYVVPARFKRAIWEIVTRQGVRWIGHNGPHDIRSLDVYFGRSTNVVCTGETYIMAHHQDSRNKMEGGVGHELKELAMSLVDARAGKWEQALKAAFKQITIPIPGAVYKSGPRKGMQKVRKARLAEGWGLIPLNHPAYIAYAAADPILTYRVWQRLRKAAIEFTDLYTFDHAVQLACDRLQRRAIRLDVAYTERLSAAYASRAAKLEASAAEYGCANIHSGQQVARTLIEMGVRLSERTPTGQYKVDGRILRALMANALADDDKELEHFLHCVLGAKQLHKRKESYTEAMLAEMDSDGRVHPSIRSLGARTARMSVSNPPLQQLPTKDREEELV